MQLMLNNVCTDILNYDNYIVGEMVRPHVMTSPTSSHIYTHTHEHNIMELILEMLEQIILGL